MHDRWNVVERVDALTLKSICYTDSDFFKIKIIMELSVRVECCLDE